MIGDTVIYSIGVDVGFSATNPTTICLLADNAILGQSHCLERDAAVYAHENKDPAVRLLLFNHELSATVEDMYHQDLTYCHNNSKAIVIIAIEYPMGSRLGAGEKIHQAFASTVAAFKPMILNAGLTIYLTAVYPQQSKEYLTGSKVGKKNQMSNAAIEHYRFNRGIVSGRGVEREGLVDAFAAAMVGRWLYLHSTGGQIYDRN
jgi:hypothetical protein